jgi:hypothetical protein
MKPIVIIAMVSILLIPSIAFAETSQEAAERRLEEKKIQTGWYDSETSQEAAERRLEEKKIQTGWYDQNVLTPTPSANSIQPSTSSAPSVSMEFIILGMGMIVVAVVVITVFLKMKKTVVKSTIPSNPQKPDTTQFWVCPNCGGNTQMKESRQYCTSCNIYLSI